MYFLALKKGRAQVLQERGKWKSGKKKKGGPLCIALGREEGKKKKKGIFPKGIVFGRYVGVNRGGKVVGLREERGGGGD